MAAADPVSLILAAIAAIAGPAVGAALAPKPNSFAGREDGTDPRKMLFDSKEKLNGLFGDLSANIGKGVSLPDAFVQGPPTFTGGGLPMPFGIFGTNNHPTSKPGMLAGLQMGGGGGATDIPTPRGPGPGNPDPTDPTGSGLPGNSPGNGNIPLARKRDAGNPLVTDDGASLKSPSFKIGGDKEQALAAFRMLGLDV